MQGRQLLASLEILPAAGDMATVDITATAGGPAAAARAAPPASIGIAGIETEGGALNGVYELNGSFPHVEGQRRPQWMMPGTRRYVRYQVKGGREPWIPRRHKRGGKGRRGEPMFCCSRVASKYGEWAGSHGFIHVFVFVCPTGFQGCKKYNDVCVCVCFLSSISLWREL